MAGGVAPGAGWKGFWPATPSGVVIFVIMTDMTNSDKADAPSPILKTYSLVDRCDV
jgi:hypothetical protein